MAINILALNMPHYFKLLRVIAFFIIVIGGFFAIIRILIVFIRNKKINKIE